MKNILKSWKTTTIGIIIIIGLCITVYKDGMNIQDAIFGLMAIGFFLSKDGDQTHSENFTTGDHPDPKKEEK